MTFEPRDSDLTHYMVTERAQAKGDHTVLQGGESKGDHTVLQGEN